MKTIVEQLAEWKRRYGEGPAEVERLLAEAGECGTLEPGEAIRLHETLLFLRAYPHSAASAAKADEILSRSAGRVTESEAFAEAEVSGIDGTWICAIYSHGVARHLARLFPSEIDIAWDAYDDVDRLGPVTALIAPAIEEQWRVEAHLDMRVWVDRERGDRTALAWLLAGLERLKAAEKVKAALYDGLKLPLLWRIRGPLSRSRLRVGDGNLFLHTAPIQRSATPLDAAIGGEPLEVESVPLEGALAMADVMVATSAMRYRELHGFTYPAVDAMRRSVLGRGVEIYFSAVAAEQRLPVRDYHAGMFFKNGVPVGYVELLSQGTSAEAGFNLYYTFREGETSWLYGQMAKLFRQELGLERFVVNPYQIGDGNAEGIQSGAFWFYRKLGFRPVDAESVRLMEREEAKMRREPGHRSTPATLRKLARSEMVWEARSAARSGRHQVGGTCAG